MSLIDRIKSLKVVPVAALEDVDSARRVADALCAGGLPCIEVTLRTAAALDAIRALAGREDLLLGAGTVHRAEQAAAAVDAGARFVVTPGFNPRTVDWCRDQGVPVFPGVSSPTDLEMAMEHDLDVVKFFPAEAMGGVAMLKAFHGPYREMRFLPTGGIHPGNLGDYLALPYVLACGGSWMVPGDLIRENRFGEVERLAREAVELATSLTNPPE